MTDEQLFPRPKIFESMEAQTPEEALFLLGNVLQSSTEYAIIGADLNLAIVFWNEGARILYGYLPTEVVGQHDVSLLFTEGDLSENRPRRITEEAFQNRKWEGNVEGLHRDGAGFPTDLVVTCRRTPSGIHIGYLLIAKGLSPKLTNFRPPA